MNDIVETNLYKSIANSLLFGDLPEVVAAKNKCTLNEVMNVVNSNNFQELCKEHVKKLININGLAAVNRIIEESKMATSANIRLKANMWIAEKALEFNNLGDFDNSPATMTQDQLARRLKELQGEANKRAKPIDTGVTEQNPCDIEDMLA